jgi:two-component system sensor histidine kinase YesM
MQKWLGQSLQRKLSFILLISTVIPLLALGVFSFTTSSRITERNSMRAGIDSLRQMSANLGFMVQDIDHMSIFLISQTDVQQFLNQRQDDVAVRARVDRLLANLVFGKPYVFDITIYPKNDVPKLSTTTIYASELKEAPIRDVREKTWTELYKATTFSGEHDVLSFIRPVRSTRGTNETIGWLSITVSERAISQFWTDPPFADAGIALVNAQGVILSATDKSWLRRSIFSLYPATDVLSEASPYGGGTYGQGKEKLTLLRYREPRTGWTLIGTIPYEAYSEQNRYILQLTAAAVALAVLITIGSTLFFVKRITNPLRTLSRLLSKVDPEQPMYKYPVDTADEIGRLAHSYNTLGEHIERLKRQMIENESRKKEADLRALQAQINPHFLYNTLSSIQWIALMNEENRIAEMVGSLGDFLRFSLNSGKDFCQVQQEIAHIRNYAAVQSIRYPDKFLVDYSVDPELTEKFMLKLLLQPLVENAMIHGIQKKEGAGTISIHVERSGSRMVFHVVDDGKGMTEAELEALRRRLDVPASEQPQEGSYGLRNVNERLQLHYGADSRLHIESKPNAGTHVSFSIPILEGPYESHDRR